MLGCALAEAQACFPWFQPGAAMVNGWLMGRQNLPDRARRALAEPKPPTRCSENRSLFQYLAKAACWHAFRYLKAGPNLLGSKMTRTLTTAIAAALMIAGALSPAL